MVKEAKEVKGKVDNKILKAATSFIQLTALHARPGFRTPGNLVNRPTRSQSLPRPVRPQLPTGHRPIRSQSLHCPIRPPHPTEPPPVRPISPTEDDGIYSQVADYTGEQSGGGNREDGEYNSEEGDYVIMSGPPVQLSGGNSDVGPDEDTVVESLSAATEIGAGMSLGHISPNGD